MGKDYYQGGPDEYGPGIKLIVAKAGSEGPARSPGYGGGLLGGHLHRRPRPRATRSNGLRHPNRPPGLGQQGEGAKRVTSNQTQKMVSQHYAIIFEDIYDEVMEFCNLKNVVVL